MNQDADIIRKELAVALKRVRALLEMCLPAEECAAKPEPLVPPERRRQWPWLCWGAGAAALVLGLLWPQLMQDEKNAGVAKVTGVFFALGAVMAGTFWPPPATGAVSVVTPVPPVAERWAVRADGRTDSVEDPLAAFSAGSPLRLVEERFGLSAFEARVLLLCAAAELDPAVPDLLPAVQEGGLRQPTFALAHRLWPEGAWDTLSENRPLLHWLLVEVRHQDGRPLTQSPLRMDDGLLQFLIGNPAPDTRLYPYHIPFPPRASVQMLSNSQAQAARALAEKLAEAAGGGVSVPVAMLTGPYPLAQQMTALAVVAACGGDSCKLLRVPLTLFPSDPRDAEHLSRLWAREAMLHGLALYVEADDVEGTALRAAWRRFFLAPRALYFLASREVLGGIPRSTMRLEVDRPTAAEQQEAWTEGCRTVEFKQTDTGLPLTLTEADAMCLADQFYLDLPAIHNAIVAVQGLTFPDSRALRRALQLAVRRENRSSLDLLAQRIEPYAGMNDLVLPDREKEQMEKYIAHVELRRRVFSEWGMGGHTGRGQGTAALFSGESGTGKTLAAEVIAARLGLDLYRIDLSAVVDKYIGETEKNLRRIFDAAESGGVILFFDEADALFGKRSEVKDSHDRYANIQINYLLQRLETYRGPALLATNLGRSMDHAFLRRLRFIVRFPQPGRDDRRRIWEKSFAPLADDFFAGGEKVLGLGERDYHAIAASSLSGGEIRNAAIHAAFLAARSGRPLTRRTVEEAINDENHKAGRPAIAGSNNGSHA